MEINTQEEPLGLNINLQYKAITDPPSNQKKRLSIDEWTKIIATTLTIIGIFIGVWEFNVQQANNQTLEFKRRIWEKKMEAYTAIGNLAAKIATERSDSMLNVYVHQFDELYWGTLPLFDDETIERDLKNFRNKVKDKQNKIIDEANPHILEITGYNLMKTCQQSLRRSFNEINN